MDKAKLTEIFAKIEEFNKIIVHTHARPDGDCTGAAFGLKDIIKTTWPEKEVYVAGENNSFVSYIGKPDELSDDMFNDALSIVVDTANSNRVGDMRFKDAAYVIKIDHHIFVEKFGNIDYVDTTQPAATLIVMDLFMLFEEKLKMTKAGATALFFGTLTDTGRCKYDGVNQDTFLKIAKLYEYGLESGPIYAYLDRRSEELTRFKGFLLQNYKKTKNGVAYIKIKPKMLKKFNVSLGEASSLVNELGHFDDCPVWLLLAEYEEKIVRARVRSKGPAINKLAAKYDGGGHAMASGANLGTWKRADLILKDADLLVKKYKEEL